MAHGVRQKIVRYVSPARRVECAQHKRKSPTRDGERLSGERPSDRSPIACHKRSAASAGGVGLIYSISSQERHGKLSSTERINVGIGGQGQSAADRISAYPPWLGICGRLKTEEALAHKADIDGSYVSAPECWGTAQRST